jgi:microcystin-dependent protein
MWAAPGAAPSGYLKCDGGLVSKITYSDLWFLLGEAYGPSNDTSFTLPNFNGRMPMGDFATGIGTNGGSADAIVVSHSHTGTINSAGLHSHSGTIAQSLGGTHTTGFEEGRGNPDWSVAQMAQAGSHTHSMSITSTGASGTGANLPPYLKIQFLIKT